MTVPLKTSRDDIVGVLQIINAMDDSGGFIPFDSALEPYVSIRRKSEHGAAARADDPNAASANDQHGGAS